MVPQNWLEWIAWAGLVVPLAALAWAAVQYVLVEQTKSRRADMERLQELALVIYNPGGVAGLTAQLFAVEELRRLKGYRKMMRGAAIEMERHFSSVPGASGELSRALAELKRESALS